MLRTADHADIIWYIMSNKISNIWRQKFNSNISIPIIWWMMSNTNSNTNKFHFESQLQISNNLFELKYLMGIWNIICHALVFIWASMKVWWCDSCLSREEKQAPWDRFWYTPDRQFRNAIDSDRTHVFLVEFAASPSPDPVSDPYWFPQNPVSLARDTDLSIYFPEFEPGIIKYKNSNFEHRKAHWKAQTTRARLWAVVVKVDFPSLNWTCGNPSEYIKNGVGIAQTQVADTGWENMRSISLVTLLIIVLLLRVQSIMT